MYRRWLGIALITGVLAVGITGGTVLAQGDGTEGDSPVQSFASRVAGILGLDETQVQDAITQARGEMRDEAVLRKLDRLVEMGRLTQEQADEYLEWYQSRPEGIFPGSGLRGFGGHGFHRGWMRGGFGHDGGFWQAPPPLPSPDSSDATSL